MWLSFSLSENHLLRAAYKVEETWTRRVIYRLYREKKSDYTLTYVSRLWALSIYMEGITFIFCWPLQNSSIPKIMIIPADKTQSYTSISTLGVHPWIQISVLVVGGYVMCMVCFSFVFIKKKKSFLNVAVWLLGRRKDKCKLKPILAIASLI